MMEHLVRGWWSGIVVTCLSLGWAADKVRLEEPVDDTRVFGVGLRLTVNGKLQTLGEDNQTLSLAMQAAASLAYRERRVLALGTQAEALKSVRDYETAQVEITVADEHTSTQLPESLKLVVMQGRAWGLEPYSLTGHLSHEEQELLTPPCDSLGFLALLPQREVMVGEEWLTPSWVAPFLARVEAVTQGECRCRLAHIEQNKAEVTFTAKVQGATLGAPCEIQISGRYEYELEGGYISLVEMRQTEKRAIGVVSAGLDVSAGLKMLRKPARIPGRVALPQVVTAAQEDPPPTAWLLRFEGWNLSLLHTRQWHLFKQTDKVAIFRLLDQGLFVAQCNLSPIPPVKPGESTPVHVFEDDIRQQLGSRLQMLEPTQVSKTPDGRQVLRTVAQGAVGERPLTWIYYLVAFPNGQQVSLMFALDRAEIDRLGQRDRELIESLRFGAPPRFTLLK
ncbi:MAG: hypothetical protein KatS3mg114_0213 [Planctomycetaceae bacterium]|nr:MAG: hypothetical protein KatS3mg114_0213 [Planctomycetaceae bacterium]